MLSKCESLCASKLSSASLAVDPAHLTLTGASMVLVLHLNVVLWEALITEFFEEPAVATLEDVDFRIVESWVVLNVCSAVLLTDMASHQWRSMCRIFAVEHEESLVRAGLFEKLVGKDVLVVVIEGAVDVAAIVLVLETAVDHLLLIVVAIILSVEDLDKSVTSDAWNAILISIWIEVWKDWLVDFINVHDGVEGAGG